MPTCQITIAILEGARSFLSGTDKKVKLEEKLDYAD